LNPNGNNCSLRTGHAISDLGLNKHKKKKHPLPFLQELCFRNDLFEDDHNTQSRSVEKHIPRIMQKDTPYPLFTKYL